MAGRVITKEQIKGFKKAMDSGDSLRSAMVSQLGYSEKTANKGRRGLSKRILGELAKEGVHFAEIGKQMTPEFQENFTRGKLYVNALEGHDKGFNSLKALGQDKRVNMFTPDSVAGIIVMEMPKSLPSLPVELIEQMQRDAKEYQQKQAVSLPVIDSTVKSPSS